MPAASKGAQASSSARHQMHLFLDGKTPAGLYFTLATVGLILLNILGFVMSTVQGYDASMYTMIEQLEDVSVVIFTVEYLLRFWASADDPEHVVVYKQTGKTNEFMSRLSWCTSFYAVVDLVSILPYYLEMFSLQMTQAACKGEGVVIDLPASQFVRIFRLLRVMRLDGKYLEAFSVFDDIIEEQKDLIYKSGFVGCAVWVILSGANWWSERNNPAMEGKMDSIGQASFYTLCNLFGEFPLVNERSPTGKAIAVFTAGVACAVFGIFCGIIGGGFQEHASKRKAAEGGDGSVKDANKESEPKLVDGQLQSIVYKIVHNVGDKNMLGKLYELVMMLLIFSNCAGFVYGSQKHVAEDKDMNAVLDRLEDVSVFTFSLDYVLRLYVAGCHEEYVGLGRYNYVTRFYPLVDLAAIAPFYVTALASSLPSINTSFIRALRLLRVLKAESYFKSGGFFTIVDDIVYDNKDVLSVTGFCAMVLWIFFSSIMHLLEKDNPLMATPDGDHYYKSIPHAMWPTLLNLSGEVPLADFTVPGRFVCGIMGIIAVGLFSIPVGIIGDGFADWASDNLGGGDDEEEEEDNAPAPVRPPPKGMMQTVYYFLEGLPLSKSGSWYQGLGEWYQSILFYLVFGTVVQQSIETVPSWHSVYGEQLNFLELISVSVFTFDYVARFLTAQHDPQFKGKSLPNIRYIFSFYSILDIATTAPYYWAQKYPGGLVDEYDEALRMLRLMRLLKMDKYIPSITLIDDVIRGNAVLLTMTGFTAFVFWIIFTTMMWMAEQASTIDPSENGVTQGMRYKDVPTALSYTLIHLSGDYPLLDYTLTGKFICFLMCLFAASVVQIPTGIIAEGFQDVAVKAREKKGKQEREISEVKIKKPKWIGDDSIGEKLHSLLSPDDDDGVWFDYSMLLFIFFDVVMVVLESDSDWRTYLGDSFCANLEGVAGFVFSFLYVLRLIAAPYDPRAGYSRWGYLTSFFGVADMIAFLPFWLELYWTAHGIPYDFAFPRMLRLWRVLQFEHYTEAFTLIDDVFRKSKDTLVATGFLSVIIWVFSAYGFYVLEKDNKALGGAFENIPNALYYTAIFLSGEWGQVDFSPLGKVLACFLVVAGIGLYAIPVGALFDAFQETLEEDDDEEEEETKKDK